MTLGEHLRRTRTLQFVGRANELALFRSALEAEPIPFNLLFVHGVGGVGKTTLLRTFETMCATSGVQMEILDCQALGVDLERTLAGWGAASRPGRRVIALDAVERVNDLRGMLCDRVLPLFSANTLVVIASRDAPLGAWREDLAWRDLMRVMPLRNLEPDESRAYLTLRLVPPERHTKLLRLSHGHPLALSLIAEVVSQHAALDLQLSDSPNIIHDLARRFIEHVPGETHREALEICAFLRQTDEEWLAALLGAPTSMGTFDWLFGLSFVQPASKGIVPHDMAREALLADLQWRNPERFAVMRRRVAAEAYERVLKASPARQLEALLDLAYVYRHSQIFSAFVPASLQDPNLVAENPRPEDIPVLVDMVRRHEGPQSAAIAARWFERQPEGITVLRELARSPQAAQPTDVSGFCFTLMLDAAHAEDIALDPFAAAVARILRADAAFKPEDRASILRFWMTRDEFQAVSPLATLCFTLSARRYLTTPRLAFTASYMHDAEAWSPLTSFADFMPLAGAEFIVDGHLYRPLFHDWRVTSTQGWLESIISKMEGGRAVRAPKPDTSRIALSQTEFARAVVDGLKHLDAPKRLAVNPLLRSAVLLGAEPAPTGKRDPVSGLRDLLRETLSQLGMSDLDRRLHRVVTLAFLEPELSHKQAAARLHVSLSTFRRDVKTATDRLVEILWQRERDLNSL